MERSVALVLKKETILLTGGTGYIGRMLAKDIVHTPQWGAGRLILPVRDMEKAGDILKGELNAGDTEVILCKGGIRDWDEETIPQEVDRIIHCACPTKSHEMISRPVETADCIVEGTRRILELAAKKKVRSMVYLSSMEVYGKVDCSEGERVSEERLGDVSLDAPRSCYPLGKRMAEHYCHIFYREYGVPVRIARLAQTFGKGVPPEDGRVFAQFAKAAAEGRDIRLHTSGMSMGNYCEISDTVNAIWTILENGRDGEVYNVVNEDATMRIRDMAQLVAQEIAGGKIKVICGADEAGTHGYAEDTGLRLSSEKMRALGWRPTKGLAEMYRELMS